MTLPNERLNALKNARQFLYDLLDPKKTPKVPLYIRRMARSCLKHYPNSMALDEIEKKLPKLFGKWPENK